MKLSAETKTLRIIHHILLRPNEVGAEEEIAYSANSTKAGFVLGSKLYKRLY